MKLPRLAALALPIVATLSLACQTASDPNNVAAKMITAVGDAHLTTDVSKSDDPQGLRDRNFGQQDFIAVSYANKVNNDNQVVVIGLTEFNLSELRNLPIQSATLQMYALRADLAQPARLVDVSVAEGGWQEADVTYNSRPAWGGNPIATTALYGGGVWYSWDVTPTLQNRGEYVSYVLGLRDVVERVGEQVLFASQNAGASVAPRLIVTYAVPAQYVPVWSVPAAAAGFLALFGIAFLALKTAGRRRSAAPRTVAPAPQPAMVREEEREPAPVGV